MNAELYMTLEKIWSCYNNNLTISNTVDYIMSLRFFVFIDTCIAAVEFWFDEFDSFFPYYNNCGLLRYLGPNNHYHYLDTLLQNNPFWKIYHFMDALKLSYSDVKHDILHLGYIYSSEKNKWIILQ